MLGGSVAVGGSSARFSANRPKLIRNVNGFRTEARGTGVIANGNTSLSVSHGLGDTPTVVIVSGRHAETAQVVANSYGSTTFNAVVPSAVTADRNFDWYAQVTNAVP